MNHRRSVAAVAVLAAVALAACGEADPEANALPNNGRQVEAARAEAQAKYFYNQESQPEADAAVNDPQAAWDYYYRVTHPAPKARGPVSANQAERSADFEARLAEAAKAAAARGPVSADAAERRILAEAAAAAAARGPLSANQAEHRAMLDVTVEYEDLRRGVDTKR